MRHTAHDITGRSSSLASGGIGRRQFLGAVGATAGSLALSAGLAGCAPTAGAGSAAQSLSKTSLQLAWLIDAQSTGEVVAKAKGFYKDSGLDIDIKPGGPQSNSVTLVASGTIKVAVAYMVQTILARSQGIPVKAFAAGLQKAPVAYYTIDKNIKSVADFKGKTIGIQPGGEVLLQVLLEHNGLKLSDVKIATAGVPVTPLVQGKVDVLTEWVSDVGTIKPLLDNPNVKAFLLYDNGLRQQSNVYIAREDTIAKEKTMLADLLEASARGWAYAYDHPDEAVDLTLAAATGLNKDLTAQGLKATWPLMFDALTKKQGWGAIDTQVWTDVIDTYRGMKQLKADVKLDDVVSTAVLDASPKRAKR